MRLSKGIWGWMLFCLACSNPPIDDGAELSQSGGSRLKLRVLIEEGGAEILDGVVDTAAGMDGTGSDCNPTRFADGSLRCVVGVLGDQWRCLPLPDLNSVVLEIEQVPLTEGVAARMFMGADGSRLFFSSFVDLDRQTPVQLFGHKFQGVNVVGPSYLVPPSADGLPMYFSQAPGASCPQSGRDLLANDGCTLTDQTTYVRRGDQIFRTEPADTIAYDCAGPSVRHILRTLDTLALDQWKQAMPVLAGTGRYRSYAWQIGHAVVPAGRSVGPWVFDTALDDHPCTRLVAEDGEIRCLPSPNTATLIYTDAQCTQPAAAYLSDPPIPRYALEWSPIDYFPGGNLEDGPVRVWSLEGAGHQATAPFYLKSKSAGCRQLFSDVRGWFTAPLGQVVSPDTFGKLRQELR